MASKRMENKSKDETRVYTTLERKPFTTIQNQEHPVKIKPIVLLSKAPHAPIDKLQGTSLNQQLHLSPEVKPSIIQDLQSKSAHRPFSRRELLASANSRADLINKAIKPSLYKQLGIDVLGNAVKPYTEVYDIMPTAKGSETSHEDELTLSFDSLYNILFNISTGLHTLLLGANDELNESDQYRRMPNFAVTGRVDLTASTDELFIPSRKETFLSVHAGVARPGTLLVSELLACWIVGSKIRLESQSSTRPIQVNLVSIGRHAIRLLSCNFGDGQWLLWDNTVPAKISIRHHAFNAVDGWEENNVQEALAIVRFLAMENMEGEGGGDSSIV